MKKNFIFVELAALRDGKPFDGVATGEFTDMWGREFEIKPSELAKYIENTQRNIEATRTESGELVGLPIDAFDHDKGDGAGWIVGVELSGENIIKFTPRWTDLGEELIGNGVRRFFSPTLDIKQKVILGGSLTNWPASREENGRILLRPIELSQQMQVIGDDVSALELIYSAIKDGFDGVLSGLKPAAQPDPIQTEEQMPVELSQLKPEELDALKAQVRTEFTSGDMPAELASIVEDRAKARLSQMLEIEQRKQHVAEFSARAVGGTEETQRGLPVQKDELEKFLTSMPAELQEQAEGIFDKILTDGLIDFAEKGHGKKVNSLTELPAAIQEKLDSGALAVADLANPMLGLGNVEDYDLSKWKE